MNGEPSTLQHNKPPIPINLQLPQNLLIPNPLIIAHLQRLKRIQSHHKLEHTNPILHFLFVRIVIGPIPRVVVVREVGDVADTGYCGELEEGELEGVVVEGV